MIHFFFFVICFKACVYNITAPSGTIHSPRFPRDYANQLRCEYNITVGVGYGILLDFQEFILEPPSPGSSDCTYDYIQASQTSSNKWAILYWNVPYDMQNFATFSSLVTIHQTE